MMDSDFDTGLVFYLDFSWSLFGVVVGSRDFKFYIVSIKGSGEVEVWRSYFSVFIFKVGVRAFCLFVFLGLEVLKGSF